MFLFYVSDLRVLTDLRDLSDLSNLSDFSDFSDLVVFTVVPSQLVLAADRKRPAYRNA